MNWGYINVLICFILVGISYPIAKGAMADIPIWIFTSSSFLVGVIFLFPICKMKDKVNFTSIPFKYWLAIGVQSLLGAVLYTAFLLYSFEYSSAITSSIFTSLAPAFVLILSYFILKEKLSTRKIFAIIIAVTGIAVLTIPKADANGTTSLIGYIFLFFSTFSTTLGVVAAKKLDIQLPALTMATGVCITGFLFSLPMAIHESLSFNLSVMTLPNVTVLIYYGVLVWAVPYACFYSGVTKIPASATGMAFSMIPISATIFSVLFFNETIHITDACALFIVTVSIFLAESEESEQLAEVIINNREENNI